RFSSATATALDDAGLSTPAALLDAARPLLGHVQPTTSDALPEAVTAWQQRLEPHQALERHARDTLTRELPALRAWAHDALAHKWLHGSSYKSTTLPGMLACLAGYAAGLPGTDKNSKAALERFSLSGMKRTKA
ncbi:exodeoxyribonuclease V subunit beta, partial [Acinetobacter baumannii]|uniref:hypothetical protein n=1 Tax=Acinetobacter baumannii TaxID=470 RepID=UPI0018E0BECC